jgi:peptidyl-prolyl cis-trans isomerase C
MRRALLQKDRKKGTVELRTSFLSEQSFSILMAKQVHAAHILVKKEDQARDLMGRINNGESFGDLAKTFSDCPSGRNGGDLGWFGRGQMVQEFERAAFDGTKGSVVGPVKTKFGWHLIKIVDQR